jgi:thiamine-phosphate pyrophosphorylase
MSLAVKSIDLHLLTNCISATDKYLYFIDECVAAGVSHVQLRQKNWQFQELLAFGKELKTILTRYKVPLIINDNLKLAVELDADGLHLGQADGLVTTARKVLGKHKIIGLSIESIEELKIANRLTAPSYVAASAVFPSQTKHNLKKIWGLTGLQQFCKISKHPVVAIGGISCKNVNQVAATGVSAIAIIDAIHSASDPKSYTQELIKLMSEE